MVRWGQNSHDLVIPEGPISELHCTGIKPLTKGTCQGYNWAQLPGPLNPGILWWETHLLIVAGQKTQKRLKRNINSLLAEDLGPYPGGSTSESLLPVPLLGCAGSTSDSSCQPSALSCDPLQGYSQHGLWRVPPFKPEFSPNTPKLMGDPRTMCCMDSHSNTGSPNQNSKGKTRIKQRMRYSFMTVPWFSISMCVRVCPLHAQWGAVKVLFNFISDSWVVNRNILKNNASGPWFPFVQGTKGILLSSLP